MIGIKFLIAVTLLSTGLCAQDKYYTKTGKISFYSKAIIENIEAHNRSVTCVLDIKTGNVQFSVPIKGFEFEKALMQEHFNENYLESDKYPKGEFKGLIVNSNEIDYTKDGVYNAKVKGKLTIHGQTNEIETDGKVTKEGNSVIVSTEFNVRLPDYKIKNEKLQNISNSIKVTVNCSLDPLKT
jgi:polyisoprenoid-binding protein YceI